jgi:iron complex transport system permease protein
MTHAATTLSPGHAAARDRVWPDISFRWLPIAMLGVVVLGLLLCELSFGVVRIPLDEAIRALVDGEVSPYTTIIWNVRLPRAVTAVLAGAALACSGLMLQTLFRNPLAGPWVLGVTSGAGLGVALVVLAGSAVSARALDQFSLAGNLSVAGGALTGAALAVLFVARVGRNLPPIALLILGLMIQYMADAAIGFLLQFTETEQLRAFGSWRDATFQTATADQVKVLVPMVLVGLIIAFLLIKPLNALLLGERYGTSVGLHVGRVRQLVLASTVMLSGVVTAFCGPVTFLDLAVPHLCRGLLRTADHRQLMVAVALLGGSIALAGDLLMHLPWERHLLHLNYITALIGVPVTIWVVFRQRAATLLGS